MPRPSSAFVPAAPVPIVRNRDHDQQLFLSRLLAMNTTQGMLLFIICYRLYIICYILYIICYKL